jgi:hypothetical protein
MTTGTAAGRVRVSEAQMVVRRNVPERPRWLFIHGHNDRAEELVGDIERRVEEETGERLEEVDQSIRIRQRKSIGFAAIAHTAFKRYTRRTILGLSLFVGQAFLYNAVFFTQALVLSTFFGVADDVVPAYIIPFAFGNLLGPVLLGRLFDSVGRRPMITLCHVLSGVLLIGTGFLEWFIGVEAAGRSLEQVARPLPAAEEEEAETTA